MGCGVSVVRALMRRPRKGPVGITLASRLEKLHEANGSAWAVKYPGRVTTLSPRHRCPIEAGFGCTQRMDHSTGSEG